MSWKDEVGGAFAYQAASFAIHPLDERRAFNLLSAMREADASWSEVDAAFRSYLHSQSASQQFVDEQMQEVERHYRPWLRY